MNNKKIIMIVSALVLVVALCFALVGCASDSFEVKAGEQLLSNGKMDQATDGKLDSWALSLSTNVAAPSIVAVDPDQDSYDPTYGTHYVRISAHSNGSYTTYSQDVALEKGAVYCLKADIRVTTTVVANGVHSAFIGLAQYDYVFSSFSAAEGWQTASVYFRNDIADSVTVVWGLGDVGSLVTSGAAQFDNILLVKLTPEEAESVIALDLSDGTASYDAMYTKTSKDTLYVALTVVLFALLALVALFAIKYLFNKEVPSLDDGDAPVAPATPIKGLFKSPTLWLVVIMLLSFGIRLLLSLTVFGYGAYGNQVMTDASALAEKGLFQGYIDVTNVYAPGVSYLLYILGSIAIPLNLTAGTLGMAIFMKIPAILADLVLLVVLFTVLNRERGLGVATIVCILFAICPVTFAASGIWGTFAPIGVLFLVLALLALRERKIIALTVWYGLAVLFMSEALLLLPLMIAFAVVTYIKYPETRIKLPVCATVAIIAGYALTIPLAIDYFILARPFIVLEKYVTYFSHNDIFARNIFGLYGMCAVGNNTVNTAGSVFGGLFAAAVLLGGVGLYAVKRNRQDLILAAGWTLAGLLVLCTRMDLWLVLPVIVLLGLYSMLSGEKRVGLIALAWSILGSINTGYALWVGGNIQGGLGASDAAIASGDPVMIAFSVFTVLLFGYLTYVAIDVCLKERKIIIDPIQNTIYRCQNACQKVLDLFKKDKKGLTK